MPFAVRPRFSWKLRSRRLELGPRTLVMGILNVTPDSFSDGGLDRTPEAAVERGLAMLDEGADVLDVGGESTRPNATPIAAQEELSRVLPVLGGLLRARPEAVLSIDTYHAETALAAVEAGAEIVNDVSGHLWDAAMASTCAALGCGCILMHTRGKATEWGRLPPLSRGGILPMVRDELKERAADALAARVERACLALDPGFGFGKLGEANFTLLAEFEGLGSLGLPLVAGLSRKRFLGRDVPQPRTTQTIAANTAAVLAGAHVLRVHDVGQARQAAGVADAILMGLG